MLCFTSPTRKRFARWGERPRETSASAEYRLAGSLAPPFIAAQRLDDFVLRGVDVLVFIHENESEFFAPAPGDFSRRAGFKIPEQLQGELLQIVKIQDAIGALAVGKSHPEFPRQPEQRRHVAAHPVPIFGQRVRSILDRGERGEKFRLVKEIFQRLAERGFSFRRPATICGNDLLQNSGGGFAGDVGGTGLRLVVSSVAPDTFVGREIRRDAGFGRRDACSTLTA